MSKRWMKRKDFSQDRGVCQRTVDTWLKEGLPYVKINGTVLIPTELADEWMMQFLVVNKTDTINTMVDDIMADLSGR